jgi:hypothetical protein
MLDRSIWPWDPAWYGEVSVELYYTLRHDPAGWPAAMIHAVPTKPPGLTWLGQFFVPLGKRIGSIERALLLENLFLQFITLVLIYRIGKVLSPKHGVTVGLVGCALVSAAPLFIDLSHLYMTEPLQTLAVTWFFYCALMSSRWGRLRILSHLISATAVAMLAKTTTPLYCLLPGLMASAQLVRRRTLADEHAGPLALVGQVSGLLFGLALLTGTIAWYKVNWETLRHHVYIASFGDIALDYGHKDIFLNKLAFWFRALREGLFTPPVFWIGTFLALVGLAVWCSRLQRTALFRWPSMAPCLALFAGLQVAGVLVMFSFTINEATRFLTAAVPLVAVLLMWAIGQVPVRLARILFVTAVMAQWGYVHAITLGLTNGGDHSWLRALDRDPTHADEVTRVIQLTSEAANRYNIVGIELPWFNANSLDFYAAKYRLVTDRRAYYTSLGYAEKDVGKALDRIDAIKTVYFISLEERAHPFPPDFLNQVSVPVLVKVQADQRFVRRSFLSQSGIVVFQRVPGYQALPPLSSPRGG